MGKVVDLLMADLVDLVVEVVMVQDLYPEDQEIHPQLLHHKEILEELDLHLIHLQLLVVEVVAPAVPVVMDQYQQQQQVMGALDRQYQLQVQRQLMLVEVVVQLQLLDLVDLVVVEMEDHHPIQMEHIQLVVVVDLVGRVVPES
jgi:hypothetical protein